MEEETRWIQYSHHQLHWAGIKQCLLGHDIYYTENSTDDNEKNLQIIDEN